MAQFEAEFARATGGRNALAVNSCTAALHLAVEALALKPEQAVLVPTMTFAATAEVVRYLGAHPVLVDCDPVTLNMSLEDAEAKIEALANGSVPGSGALPVGVLPVHVGGLMLDVGEVGAFAHRHGLWVVEDAAHAFPAAWRRCSNEPWQRCGAATAAITCYSFYANKTITTGEGGMAVTESEQIIARMRQMALHGLSRDAWDRYSSGGSWDYRIVAPGFKYNMTDVAAALGICQLRRAEEMRLRREAIALRYRDRLGDLEEVELPPHNRNRLHAWHLFPIRLRLECLDVDRNAFVEDLRSHGVGFSVHWRPLHLHPYYEQRGWRPEHCPVATAVWPRLVSLPIFPGMREEEMEQVVRTMRDLCRVHRRRSRV